MSSFNNTLEKIKENIANLKGDLNTIMEQQTKILERNDQILSKLEEPGYNGTDNHPNDTASAIVPRPICLAQNKRGVTTAKKIKLSKDDIIQALHDCYQHPTLSTEAVYKGLLDAAYFRVNILLQKFKADNNQYPTWKALGPTIQCNLASSIVHHSRKKGIDLGEFEENWLVFYMARKTYQNHGRKQESK